MRRGMRRGLLLASLALCGGATVTLASWLGKPAVRIATPVVPAADSAVPGIALQGPDALKSTGPRAMPDISFQDEAGGTHHLAEFAGRVVVLNLWATWCQPCIAELPALARLAASDDPDIAVIALASDRGGAATVRRFFAAHGLALPVRVDPFGSAAEALGARGLPTTVLIDRGGRERARLEGAADWAAPAMRARLLQLAG